MNPIADIVKGGLDAIVGQASNIIKDFKADPTKVVEAEAKLKELQIQASTKAQEIQASIEETQAKELESVNATMREEGKSEHWAQWLWRPMVGFTFCAILLNNYILLPYLKKYGAEVIVVPDTVFTAILVILGAASAGRGLTQWQKAKNDV